MSLTSRPILLQTVQSEFDPSVAQKKFASKSVSQYCTYIKDQKRKNKIVTKFKFQLDISSGFTLTRSQQIALDAVDRFLSPESNVGKYINFGIYGKAGVGKSALINIITRRFVRRSLQVQVLGPTGYCVSQYEGAQTIHSFFGIGTSPDFESFISLPPKKGLKEKLKKLHLIIIDEMGLVSTFLFQFINSRLQFLCDSCEPFGGISIILIFDPLQLPCIKSKSLWSDPYEINTDFGKAGQAAFKTFTFFKLEENVRQKDDSVFQEILENFRYKTVKQRDVDLLSERLSNRFDLEYSKDFCRGAVHLYSTNVECNSYNLACLRDLGSPIVRLAVKYCMPTFLAVGARVILLRNFWTQAGLTSGITGTVVGILYSSNSEIGIHLPMIVFVKFDRSLGIKCCEDGSIPIPRVRERVFDAESGKYYMVTKFPLLLAFGITISRSQSATLSKACIKFGREFSLQLSYVALSRVEKLENLMILNENLTLDRFSNDDFFRGFSKLRSNLIRLGLEPAPTLPEGDFDSEGNELIFKMDLE
jgi:hypothetical protein